ncbi:hypothetical protein Cpir12675_000084 [Ceratocystis pirilliformis]|uniref:Uncharacterized protein n=1 Tax=Ceratocystis pirilliformis TaxID=259994 RepID=A0ABR3ZP00_9PEZI
MTVSSQGLEYVKAFFCNPKESPESSPGANSRCRGRAQRWPGRPGGKPVFHPGDFAYEGGIDGRRGRRVPFARYREPRMGNGKDNGKGKYAGAGHPTAGSIDVNGGCLEGNSDENTKESSPVDAFCRISFDGGVVPSTTTKNQKKEEDQNALSLCVECNQSLPIQDADFKLFHTNVKYRERIEHGCVKLEIQDD